MSALKQSELASIQLGLSGGGGGGTGSGGTCSTAPAAPSGLLASVVSSSQINLTWSAVTPPSNCAVSYSVFRSTSSGFTPSSTNQVASGLTLPLFSNTGLSSKTTYYFKVEAKDSVGVSPPSNQASATTQASSSGSSCHITYTNVNQWNSGFQVALTIQNTGTVPLSNWTLTWTFPNNQHITSLWNASYVQSGENVRVTNLSYNGSIPAGGSYNGVGFTANYSGTNATPSTFWINGVQCR